jgi:hypothetical protein
MKYKYLVAMISTIYICCTYAGYCQVSTSYGGIDTENVLSYKVDEIIVMRFGGSSTHYNVSDLKLISKVNLGPGNIRIITPVYKGGKPSKKYFVEFMTVVKGRSGRQEANTIYEITSENNQIKIGNNSKADPSEKVAILKILNKSFATNKIPYIKPQAEQTKQNPTIKKKQDDQKANNYKILNQKIIKKPITVSVFKEVPKKKLITKIESNNSEDILSNIETTKITERESKIRLLNEKIDKAKLLRDQAQIIRVKANDSIIQAVKEARFRLQKESRVAPIRVVAARSPRTTMQSRITKTNMSDGNVQSKKNVEPRTFKEKNKRKSLVELIEERRIRKDALTKRPKQELQKESKNNNLRRPKDRRRGKVKVAEESFELTRVRYDKSKDNSKIEDVKDSVKINSREDSLNGLDVKKIELSATSFKLNKLRNSKSTDRQFKQNKKEDNNAVMNKRERKAMDTSLDFPESKQIKNYTETDKNKEFRTKIFESVIEAKLITAIPINTATSTATVNLQPSTMFSLSNMLPKLVVSSNMPPAKQNTVVVNVIATYERIVKKGYKSVDLFQKIGDSYFFSEDMETAVLWYEKLFDLSDKIDPVYYFRYGTALQKVGKATKGDKMIEKFNQLKK